MVLPHSTPIFKGGRVENNFCCFRIWWSSLSLRGFLLYVSGCIWGWCCWGSLQGHQRVHRWPPCHAGRLVRGRDPAGSERLWGSHLYGGVGTERCLGILGLCAYPPQKKTLNPLKDWKKKYVPFFKVPCFVQINDGQIDFPNFRGLCWNGPPWHKIQL